MKKEAARKAWEEKSDAEKLLAWAKELKENISKAASVLSLGGQLIVAGEGDCQAFALEGLSKTQHALVLYHVSCGRDAPVLIAQVSLEPAVEVVPGAGHGEPAFRAADMVEGSVLEPRHGVRRPE